MDNKPTVECNMKFRFHLKNGKTHDFSLPDDVEVHRAIVCTSKKNRREMTRVIIIPDNVDSIEAL
jgi:hypothetical protein